MIAQEIRQELRATRPEPLKRYGEVQARIGADQYQIRDQRGRKYNVTSSTSWRIGDAVTVKNGRIVGRARKFISPKTHQL